MLPDGTIVANRLWKRFQADRQRPVLRDELERLRNRGAGASDRWRWVLRDVDFRIEPGEAVGLFGTNGSGKSTLLKILTQIMYPHSGRLDVVGRVGALIEIRAGIHPDLTGRENVFLYGSLLGLQRAEVLRRFDEIIEFAELESAVDRQVKFYSSGMSMRLGFAVAAFLHPDILLVDEVLAVGDALFQKKCLDRMGEVLREGTTLVFVSHDLPTIESICQRGLWLDDGTIRFDGDVRAALGEYRGAIESRIGALPADADVEVRKALVRIGAPPAARNLDVDLEVGCTATGPATIVLGITDGSPNPILVATRSFELSESVAISCVLRDIPLAAGNYAVWMSVHDPAFRQLFPWHPIGHFTTREPHLPDLPPGMNRLTPVVVQDEWSITDGSPGADDLGTKNVV